jgi:hypothetical protein
MTDAIQMTEVIGALGLANWQWQQNYRFFTCEGKLDGGEW